MVAAGEVHSGNVARDACVRALAVEVAGGLLAGGGGDALSQLDWGEASTAPPQLRIHGVTQHTDWTASRSPIACRLQKRSGVATIP
jgi:hypothetical protein